MEYTLSGRIKLEGVGDYIADLNRAERATKDLVAAAKSSAKLDFDTRGVLADLDKLDRGVRDLYQLVERESRLTIGGLDSVTADLRQAEQAARDLAQAVDRVGSVNAGGGAGGIRQIGDAMDDVDSKAVRLSGSIGKVAANLADMAARGAMYEFVDLLGQGLMSLANGFLDFDESMTNALAITKGVSAGMRSEMEDTATTLSNRLGVAAADVADIYYDLFSSGMTAEQAIEAVGVVAEFATASMIDFGKAGDYLVTATNALGLAMDDPIANMENMIRVGNDLVAINNLSVGTVEDFAKALTNKAGTAMKTFGIDTEVGIATLGAFAERGVLGLKAGEQLSMMIRDLGKAFTANSGEWEKAGVAVFDAGGNFRNVGDILIDLNDKLGPMSDQLKQTTLLQLGLTLRSQQSILTLLDAGPRIKELTGLIKLAGDELGAVAENQLEAFRRKIGQVVESVKNASFAGIEAGLVGIGRAAVWMGDTFGPAAQGVVDLLRALWEAVGPVVEAFAAVAGIAVVGTLQGIAAAVAGITGVLAANEGVVQAFALALTALAVPAVVGAIAAIASTIAGPLIGAISSSLGFMRNLGVEFGRMREHDGTVRALSGSFGSLAKAIGPELGIALLIGAIADSINSYKKGEQAAREFAEEVMKKRDIKASTLGDIDKVITDLEMRWQDAQNVIINGSKGVGNAVASTLGWALGPLTDDSLYDNMRKAGGEMDGLRAEIERLRTAGEGAQFQFGLLARAFLTGADSASVFEGQGSAVYGELKRIGGIAREYSPQMAGMFDNSSEGVRRLTGELAAMADAMGIDVLNTPFAEWGPQLARAYAEAQLTAGAVQALAGQAERVNAAALSPALLNAYGTLGDETADLTSKFDALRKVMDEVFNPSLEAWDATTKMREAELALYPAIAAMQAAGVGLDDMSEASFKARDGLSAVVGAALEYADKMGREGGDMAQVAVNLETQRNTLLGILEALGYSAEEAAALVNQLGLTPKKILAIARAGDFGKGGIEDATTAAEGLSKELDAAGAARTPTVTPEMDAAALALAQSDLAGLSTPVVVPVKANTDPAFLDIEGLGSASWTPVTVDAEADTGPAETTVRTWADRYRSTTVGTEADTGPAETTVRTWADRYRSTTVDAGANIVNAERDLAWVTRGRTQTTEVTLPNAGGQNAYLDTMARYRGQTTEVNLPNAGGQNAYLDAMARYRAQTTDVNLPNAAGLNAYLDYLARNRTMSVQVTYWAANQPNPDGTANIASAARGGIIEYYAQGGTRNENHVAQIAPAGAMRVWAEQETGGEGYVPLANDSRRGRALQTWAEIGRRFGMLPGMGDWSAPASPWQGSRSSGGTVVNVPAGAVAVNVSAAVGADPGHLANLVGAAVGPAMAGFASDLATRIRRN